MLSNSSEQTADLQWRETRTMFGKAVTEEMWVPAIEENRRYKVRAESLAANPDINLNQITKKHMLI